MRTSAPSLIRGSTWLVMPLVLILILAACADDEPTTEEEVDAEAEAETDDDLAEEDVDETEESDDPAEVDDVLAPLDERETVRVGAVRVVNLAPTWMLQELADEYNIEVEYVEFGRFADARTALAAEEIDFTTFGPQDIALALADGQDNLVGLAGAGQGNDALTMAVDAGFSDWSDLDGASVGIGAGSISWVKFAASIAEADGIEYTDIDIVNIAGGGTAYLQAMERGDIDLAVLWEPFAAQALDEGIGEYPPFDHNESEVVGGQFAVFSTTESNVSERPEVVQRMVNAYVDAVEMLQDDTDLWVETAVGYTELEPEVVETAIARSDLGYHLDLPRITNIAEFLVENAVISELDMTALDAAHRYEFLEARTGQPAAELGRE